jgi:hypothetical protein
MPKKTPAQHFKAIYALATGGATQGERDSAKGRVKSWLKRQGKTEADILSILQQAFADDAAQAPPPPPSDPRDADPGQPAANINLLDLIRALAEDYFVFESPHEYVAFTLWAAHTHVYELFQVTPRLVMTSPTSGCGKSVVMKVLDRLVARPEKSDNFTVASMYDAAHYDRKTLLVDEADNLPFGTKRELRAVFNSGYDRGGVFTRKFGKRRLTLRTNVPLAMASIGVLTPPGTLPPPLMRRSITLLMLKHRHQKRRFVAGDTAELDYVYQQLGLWGRNIQLNPDPELPDELKRGDPSVADNWRPLISVADAFSPIWGRLAREAAIFFARSGRHEDPVVTLLRDIRTVFDTLDTDRVLINVKPQKGKPVSAAMLRLSLLPALHDMESGYWSEFCGRERRQQPHKLTEAELRAMLRPLGIVTHSVWPQKGAEGDRSGKGYTRADFAAAWRAYLDESETGKPAKVVQLRPPESA